MKKNIINSILRKAFGVHLKRFKPNVVVEKAQDPFFNTQNLLFEKDQFFNDTYDLGIKVTGTPFDDLSKYFTKRRIRFYNTIQLFLYQNNLRGSIIECGCFKGLSSFIMCNYLKKDDLTFDGSDFLIVDSFEGLSKPTTEDALKIDEDGKENFFVEGGHFATPLEVVKSALKDFPNIKYYKGWIPEVYKHLPNIRYKFVHIDVDLYNPIKASLEYFFPKLVDGGVIVVDDYGSLYWPGAQRAVEEFCQENNVSYLKISTAQAVIWKQSATEV